jgi:hypothetical protein
MSEVTKLANWNDHDILARATTFNSTIAANTNIFGSNISPLRAVSVLRIQVAITDSSTAILATNLIRSATTVQLDFNSGQPLDDESLYIFDMTVRSGDAINFELSSSAKILVLNVDEVYRGA